MIFKVIDSFIILSYASTSSPSKYDVFINMFLCHDDNLIVLFDNIYYIFFPAKTALKFMT